MRLFNGDYLVPVPSPDNQMSGTDAEARIRQGDILLWSGDYGISRFFKKSTRSSYSHAAFVLHWEGHPMVLQAGVFGIHAFPLKETIRKYNGQVYWYQLKDADRQNLNLGLTITEATGDLGLPFGLRSVLREFLYRLIGLRIIRRSRKRRRGMFCSEYVSKCFRKGGVDLAPELADDRTFPDDMAKSGALQFQKIIHTPKTASHLLIQAARRLEALGRDLVHAVRRVRPESPVLVLGQSPPEPKPDSIPGTSQTPDVGPPAPEAHPGDGGAR